MRRLETALALAYAGHYIVPLLPPKSKKTGAGKRPMLKDWPNQASNDPEVIEAWFEQNPDINIGVVMGRSKIFGIDIDPRNGGLEWYNQHQEEILRAKNCVIEESGKGDGGRHLCYLLPEDLNLPKSVKVKGVDLLCGNKQMVVAPSIHPDTLEPYQRVSENTLETIRDHIPEIPDCVMELLELQGSTSCSKKTSKSKDEEDRTDYGPPTDLNTPKPATPEEREMLEYDLAMLDPSIGRHAAIGDWIINAVACQMPDEEILHKANVWLEDQGRDPSDQPMEVHNWIRDAKKGLVSGKYQPADRYRPERLLDQIANDEDDSSWLKQLDSTEKGGLKKSRKNVIDIITHDPRMRDVLAYNLHAQSTALIESPPWDPSRQVGPHGVPIVDSDLVFCSDWIARHYHLEVSVQMVLESMELVARRRNYHPVQDCIEKVEWDGKSRVDTVFQDYFGAEGDAKYLAACARSLFIGGVARAYRPGCKHDQMVIIEGDQGIRKSTALGIIGGDFFADDLGGEIGQKDVVENIRHCWCIEQAELDHFTRAETNRFKAFLSRTEDRVRLSYGRLTQVFPRQCFFVGTTNSQDYLRDATGGRRFLPVPCWSRSKGNPIDTEGLQDVIDQLWAEALHHFRNGVEWWVTDAVQKLAEEMQASRQQEDVMEEKILAGLDGRDASMPDGRREPYEAVTTSMVWEKILEQDVVDCKQADRMRIGNILSKHGWERVCNKRHRGSSPTSWYFRPKAS